MNMLDKAINIASNAFLGKVDKQGRPYILHLIWVMNKVRHLGEIYMIVAVLHDLLEDTDWTIEGLMKEGFSQEITEALDLLTHYPTEAYENYVSRLSTNTIAREVKMRDLEHNSKITRLKGIRDKDVERLRKYNQSYLFLKNIVS